MGSVGIRPLVTVSFRVVHDREDGHERRFLAAGPVSALWTSMLFVFAYVDLFSSFRADVRADIEAGKMFAFTIGQGFLLGGVVYYAWTWSKTTNAVGPPADQSPDGARVHSAPHVRG